MQSATLARASFLDKKKIRFSMALSEGKNKRKRWSAIFVAVDGLPYMPNESSALSDGFAPSFFGANRANT